MDASGPAGQRGFMDSTGTVEPTDPENPVDLDEPAPPQDRVFYKILSHVMASICMHSELWWWYKYPRFLGTYFKVQSISVYYGCQLTFASQIVFLALNFSKLNIYTRRIIYSIIPIGFLVVVKERSAQFKIYYKVMLDFMDKIHLYNYYRNNKDEFVKQILIQVEKVSLYVGAGLAFFLWMCWFMWMLTPIIHNMHHMEEILNGTDYFQSCAYLWMPFDYLHDYKKWLIESVFNVYITIFGVTMIITFDTINYIMVFHLIGHIHILKYNVRTRFTEKESDEETKRKLIDILNHHCFIHTTFQDVENAFGLNVAGNYLQNLVEDGLLLYQFMLGDKESVVTYGLTLFIYLGGLVLMSLVLEEIRRQSEDLPETVYCIPWEDMSITNQKIFLLILARVQPILEFRALGGFRTGVLPAFNIIKTTFSYYVMIKSGM